MPVPVVDCLGLMVVSVWCSAAGGAASMAGPYLHHREGQGGSRGQNEARRGMERGWEEGRPMMMLMGVHGAVNHGA